MGRTATGSRKDKSGHVLRPGETQRSKGDLYCYSYTDSDGTRRFVYSASLVDLREKERAIRKNLDNGINSYAAATETVNSTFDRMIELRKSIRDTTKSNYQYMYNRFIRETSFGKKKLIDVRYSDVLGFYNSLIDEQNLSVGTVDTIHTVLHLTFDLAVKDDLIRKNPTAGVIREIRSRHDVSYGVRKALTHEQQKRFMQFVANDPVASSWWPLFTVLLGTGMRIGECIALRWCDIDYEKNVIHVEHNFVYYAGQDTNQIHGMYKQIGAPKTSTGIRTIPLLPVVKEAFDILKSREERTGPCREVISGLSGFIFQNRYGDIMMPSTVNRAITRFVDRCNEEEILAAEKEKREPVIVPHFSCHILRHTFATRLCECESNLKVIQSIMGHKDIETTMDVYAEATEQGKERCFNNLDNELNALF